MLTWKEDLKTISDEIKMCMVQEINQQQIAADLELQTTARVNQGSLT
jgi:hypothetical protein